MSLFLYSTVRAELYYMIISFLDNLIKYGMICMYIGRKILF